MGANPPNQRQIWKYPVPMLPGRFEIAIPGGREVLSVAVQDGAPVMWIAVDPKSTPFPTRFHLHFTGQDLDPYIGRFVGSFCLDGLVFHLFEDRK